MMPKHASVVVCSTLSVVSGAILLATEYNHCPVPVTINGKILQLTARKLCWLLTIHFLPEVKERPLLWSCWVCLVWLSEYHIRHDFIIKTKVQAENDNSMKIFVKFEMPICGSGSSLYSCLILVYQFCCGDNWLTQALCLFCAQHCSEYLYVFI